MKGEVENAAIAQALAKAVCGVEKGAFENNLIAVLCADAIAAKKGKGDIEEICKFFQLVVAALKSYL